MGIQKKIISLSLILICCLFPIVKVQAATTPGKEEPTPDFVTDSAASLTDLQQSKLSDENIVVYINWDGFAQYYFELAENQGKVPNLSRIKADEGVYFTNAYTQIPSITNPMQAAIVSGTTPKFTDNHYRYFDKELNILIQEAPSRKNEAETLAEAAVRQKLEVIAINQFAFEDRGTISGDPSKAYITAPNGINGYCDGAARFDEAIGLVKTLKAGGLSFDKMPRLIALYMDDLDAIGHNIHQAYGLTMAVTEEARRQAVVERLAIMDRKLGEFIQACKEANLYNRMSFVLTTDHGMAPYGLQKAETDDSVITRMSDMLSVIEALGPGYKCEILSPGGIQTPAPETNIAVVTVGLQVQLSYIGEFDPTVITAKNQKIAEILRNKNYIGRIMFPDEIVTRGAKTGFADLIISPRPPYHFRPVDTHLVIARGQHDSLADEAQHIVAFMWGKNIKKGLLYQETVYNYDFTPTMAKLLGIDAPLDATGKVIYNALDFNNNQNFQESNVKYEDSQALGNEATERYPDDKASGGTVTSLSGNLASLEFPNIPAAKKLIIHYSSNKDVKLSLYVNDQLIRMIFFPATVHWGTKYEQKIINYSCHSGDVLKLVNNVAPCPDGIKIDYLTFSSEDPAKVN